MRKPELVAPGGSFLSAHYALQAGADGVYLGLKEFSARKVAVNFTLEQLRRIRGLAADLGKKIYVTMNTVVTDVELGKLSENLAWLEALGIDGVIVQDLGVYALVKRDFPRLSLHASTQMAIHNSAGLVMAKQLGFRRVILSRELSFERIAALRQEHQDIELEVFVHGALCYSFSGACLASWALAGRSGNRGDCAQICRSLFRHEGGSGKGRLSTSLGRQPRHARREPMSPPPSAVPSGGNRAVRGGSPGEGRLSTSMSPPPSAIPGEGHFFSCRDLFLGRDALKLAAIGIDAFKIEGRMKSPEYAFATVKLYRAILDRGNDLTEPEYEELVRHADLAFSREKSTGFFHSPLGVRLINAGYPGHGGSPLGKVEKAQGREITLRPKYDLSLHDGLGFFQKGSFPGRSDELVVFPVQRLRRSGREVKFVRAGESTQVEVPVSASESMPPVGAVIRHLSSRFLDLPALKETSFASYKVPVDLEICVGIQEGGGVLTVRLIPGAVLLDPIAEAASLSRHVTLDTASGRKPMEGILASLFAESASSLFTVRRLSFVNRTGMSDDRLFIPPSELKKAKKDFYTGLDSLFMAVVKSKSEHAQVMESIGEAETTHALSREDIKLLARRELLTPKGCHPIPFAWLPREGIVREGMLREESPREEAWQVSSFAKVGGFTMIPLPPVMLDETRWISALKRLANTHGEVTIGVGLNNVSHIAVAAALHALPNVCFFIDFYLYLANRHTLSFLSSRVPRLLFAYCWIEGEPGDCSELSRHAGSPIPIVRVSRSFNPPLFYSLGCFIRHSMNGGACIEDCPRDFEHRLRQGRNRFQVIVRDCVTYLFRELPSRPRAAAVPHSSSVISR